MQQEILCPICKTTKAQLIKRLIVDSYHGMEIKMPSLEIDCYYCPNCQEDLVRKGAFKEIYEKFQ